MQRTIFDVFGRALVLALFAGILFVTVFYLLPHLAGEGPKKPGAPLHGDPSPEPWKVTQARAEFAKTIYEEARQEQAQHHPAKAYKLIYKAISIDPWNIEHLQFAAPLALAQERYQRAARWYNRLSFLHQRNDPPSFEAIIHSLEQAGAAYELLGDHQRAQIRLNKALTIKHNLQAQRRNAVLPKDPLTEHSARAEFDLMRTRFSRKSPMSCPKVSTSAPARFLELNDSPTPDYLELLKLEIACRHRLTSQDSIYYTKPDFPWFFSAYLQALVIAEKLEEELPGSVFSVESEIEAYYQYLRKLQPYGTPSPKQLLDEFHYARHWPTKAQMQQLYELLASSEAQH
jgi:tetratricopeptide (TPR) repeat protein